MHEDQLNDRVAGLSVYSTCLAEFNCAFVSQKFHSFALVFERKFILQ